MSQGSASGPRVGLGLLADQSDHSDASVVNQLATKVSNPVLIGIGEFSDDSSTGTVADQEQHWLFRNFLTYAPSGG